MAKLKTQFNDLVNAPEPPAPPTETWTSLGTLNKNTATTVSTNPMSFKKLVVVISDTSNDNNRWVFTYYKQLNDIFGTGENVVYLAFNIVIQTNLEEDGTHFGAGSIAINQANPLIINTNLFYAPEGVWDESTITLYGVN